MDWIVLGDHWAAPPSTVQQLMLHLPEDDRVVWIESNCQRGPRFHLETVRALSRALGFRPPMCGASGEPLFQPSVSRFVRIRPTVVPWHCNPLICRANRLLLASSVGRLVDRLALRRPFLLTSNPFMINYLQVLPAERVGYLRHYRYDVRPGGTPTQIRQAEEQMLERADAIICTARGLVPGGHWRRKAYYLPQGVDTQHFGQAALDPPGTRVLGFFGAITRWLDFKLIGQVAALVPEWRLEFIGPVHYVPHQLRRLPNVTLLPPIPFSRLPSAVTSWKAAWIPFKVSRSTNTHNPLKAREYLAAGLATHSTPLPEVAPLTRGTDLLISDRPEEIAAWLRYLDHSDTRQRRAERRRAMARDSWTARATELRCIMNAAMPAPWRSS